MAIQIRDEESIFGRPLRRSRKKRMIAGVCGGLADWLESDATVIRVFFVVATVLMGIAGGLLAGELAAEAGRVNEAVGHLARAMFLEDSLAYNEPPDWFLPVRHVLGAVLLEAGRPVEAEALTHPERLQVANRTFALYGARTRAPTPMRNSGMADADDRRTFITPSSLEP